MHNSSQRPKFFRSPVLHTKHLIPLMFVGVFAFAAENGPGGPPAAQPNDPGVRAGAAAAGAPIAGLTTAELAMFSSSRITFQEVDDTDHGLGPRFNLDSCAGCHAYPATGGSSPSVNPQIAVASASGARNTIPPFLTLNGPVREVRFRFNPDGSRDGGVKALFTIAGRSDAAGCNLAQSDFTNTANLAFRIPTPLFGAGLIEAIPDTAIRSNLSANAGMKSAFGISGKLNTSGNDGTVTRFGWKAQNKSLAIFCGEAYNVEQGVSNELFPNKRDETAACQYGGSPNDQTNFVTGGASDVIQFAIFGRLLAAPTPAAATPSTTTGAALFTAVGCALCHTPTLTTGRSAIAALSSKRVNLYSDLAVHSMGSGLADNIIQGNAGPDEFRTAPLWGLGQRIFFLHDGRTSDLVRAIQEHSSQGSEANASVQHFSQLGRPEKQDVLNFLRSL